MARQSRYHSQASRSSFAEESYSEGHLEKLGPNGFDTPSPRKGRGAVSNVSGRFESLKKIDFDDGWRLNVESSIAQHTRVLSDNAKSVITRNTSPDIYFDRSINPYRGCEHGCIYCFARPTHTYLGHSAGLDFERIIYAKHSAAERLKSELAKPGYRAQPIAIGVNTDAYQPIEKKLRITRSILEVLESCDHPVFLITKSSLIERDLDLLVSMSQKNLVTVSISITTLDHDLARRLEPRATSPSRRLRTIKTLSEAGVRVRVSVSPIIPALNEEELDVVIKAAAESGAVAASYILLRLPHELAQLFPEWLREHYPLRANRILKAIDSVRQKNSNNSSSNENYKLNDAEFGSRMAGFGPRAEIIRRRFEAACRREKIATNGRETTLDCSLFKAPSASGQLSLF